MVKVHVHVKSKLKCMVATVLESILCAILCKDYVFKVIFINNASAHLGKIEAIKEINKDDVILERVTSGTIKPRIKL